MSVVDGSTLDTYAVLRSETFGVGELLKYHFVEVIKLVYKKITQKENFRNPWEIILKREIFSQLYIQFYRAIKDFRTSFGRTVTVDRDSKNKIKSIKIVFTNLSALKLHLKELTNLSKADISKYFARSWKNGNTAKVVVSEEKPVVFIFKISTNSLVINMSYELKNKYGTVCV